MVQNVDLGPNSISADVDVLIFERYAGLAPGLGVLGHERVNARRAEGRRGRHRIAARHRYRRHRVRDAEREVAAGQAGTVFFLHDKPKEEWLSLPRIPILPAEKNPQN